MRQSRSLFVKETLIQAPCELVFAFHERADAFSLLLPPWQRTRVLRPPSSLEVGTVVVVETKLGPFWTRIEAEHVLYVRNERFDDVMRKGPFAHWHHKHLFIPHGRCCVLRDEVSYRLPFGSFGRRMGGDYTRNRLAELFTFRHEVTATEVSKMCALREARAVRSAHEVDKGA